MNRDTLDSIAVFDLTTPVTIVKPDPGKRFWSMQAINQDHSMQPTQHGAGSFTLTREEIGTRSHPRHRLSVRGRVVRNALMPGRPRP